MTVQPDLATFRQRYRSGTAQVVWRTLVADLETPVSAFLKLGDGAPYAFLLESVEGGALRGRYSTIGLRPDLVWRCVGDRAWINRDALSAPDAFAPCPVAEKSGTLDSFRALIAESRIDIPDSLPPMASGLFGYMAYDTVRLVERLPEANPDPLGIPDGVFVRPTVMAMFDNVNGTLTAVVPVWPRAEVTAEAAYDRAVERLDGVIAALDSPLPHAGASHRPVDHQPVPVHETSAAEYAGWVAKAKEYIAAGDIFQVVLSQRLSVPFKLPPFSLYRALRRTNPSPFLFYLDFVDFQVVGSSPEILVRLRDGTVTIRPIAGTRRRGVDAARTGNCPPTCWPTPRNWPST